MSITVEMYSPSWAMTMLGHNMAVCVTGDDKQEAVAEYVTRSESMYGPWWKHILCNVLLVQEIGVDEEPETWIIWPHEHKPYTMKRCYLDGKPQPEDTKVSG